MSEKKVLWEKVTCGTVGHKDKSCGECQAGILHVVGIAVETDADPEKDKRYIAPKKGIKPLPGDRRLSDDTIQAPLRTPPVITRIHL